jgi:hypothetical protein
MVIDQTGRALPHGWTIARAGKMRLIVNILIADGNVPGELYLRRAPPQSPVRVIRQKNFLPVRQSSWSHRLGIYWHPHRLHPSPVYAHPSEGHPIGNWLRGLRRAQKPDGTGRDHCHCAGRNCRGCGDRRRGCNGYSTDLGIRAGVCIGERRCRTLRIAAAVH